MLACFRFTSQRFARFLTGIKSPNPKTAPKQRRTLAKQIKALAAEDIHAAMLLAEKGWQLTEIERQLNNYFHELEEFLKIKSGKKTKYQIAFENTFCWTEEGMVRNKQVTQKLIEQDRARFCKIFIAAIDARDSEKIYEIGRAIDRLKAIKDAADRYRSEILNLKRVLDISRSSLTIRQVAKAINWPHEGNPDGFSQLRRLCFDLKFPLARSRQIRRK